MCDWYGVALPNVDYMNDTRRGRHADPERFRRLHEYAQKRWERTRDLRWSDRWIALQETIDRRSWGPKFIGYGRRHHA